MNFVRAIANGTVEFASGFWTAFVLASPIIITWVLVGLFVSELL
jgi:flagellar biosynthesis protein FliQ